jgi:hypothetical protein
MSWVLDQRSLHITAGSMPQFRIEGKARNFDLHNELQMVKVALLYGDHAKLCGFAPAALFDIAAMTDVTEDKRLEFLQEAASWPMMNQALKEKIGSLVAEYQHAKRRRYNKRGKLALEQLDEQLDHNWHLAKQKMAEIMSEAGGDGIVEAVRSGLLDVHTFGRLFQRRADGIDATGVIAEYVKVLSAAVADAHTYLLFDEITGDLISSRIANGTIPVYKSGIKRARQVALAADLFGRLPLFPRATVKEILDIRSELESPLRSFRSAIIKFSKRIHEAPWDDDFATSAESLFRKEVEPSILTIEEQVNSNRFLIELTSRLVPVGAAAIPTTLAISMSNLPTVAIAALAIIEAIIGAATATQAYRQWAKDRQTTQQNDLYFYYKTGQLLADGTYEYFNDKER